MKYQRILLKVSGGALSGKNDFGFDKEALDRITDEIIKASNAGVEVAVLIGGGNIFRGRTAEDWNIERAEADNIGMMATVINSLILRGALVSKGAHDLRVMSAVPMNTVAEPYIRLRAVHHLDKGKIVVFGGGIGQPYVTTDYASLQRALEIRADVVLMAKQGTDGVYTDNPNTNPDAKRYKTLSYDEAINKNLKVVDQSAFILAKDYDMPMYIFDFNQKDSILDICEGKNVGTFVGKDCETEMYE
ncbi:MAG: UMP kinase [Clostridia bacterium]|nr:UMP kinase [Clostridia bacterium]